MTRATYDAMTGRGAHQFTHRTLCSFTKGDAMPCVRLAGHRGEHATTETGKVLAERGALGFIRWYDAKKSLEDSNILA